MDIDRKAIITSAAVGASVVLLSQFFWSYNSNQNLFENIQNFIRSTSNSQTSQLALSSSSNYLLLKPSESEKSNAVNQEHLTLALRPNAFKREDPIDPSPRELYLSWDDYFMSVAHLSSLRSKDPNKQVGACIVGIDRVILGIGYNGFPRGCSDHQLPWAKKSLESNPLDTKYPYVCHAEMNAIMNKNAASLKGCSMYVTMFPCNNCAKLLIQAGITEVIYFEDKRRSKQSSPAKGRPDPSYEASQQMLSHAGVTLRQHVPVRPVFLDFSL
jgi:dCMP deaminase